MRLKITDQRVIGEAVEDSNVPDDKLMTSRELVVRATKHRRILGMYESRITAASEELLKKYGSDEGFGPAIREVASSLKTFLPVEKGVIEPIAWGEVPIKMNVLFSPHTSLLGGIFKGGIRMTSDVDVTTLKILSSDMTRKLALLDLPMNGGKSCVIADAGSITGELKEQAFTQFTNEFFRFMGPLGYVPAGDVGTDTPDMEVIRDAYAANLRRLAAGILAGNVTTIGPREFTPPEGREYFRTNVIGVEPSDEFLQKIASDAEYARMTANPAVTAKPEDAGGHAIRRGATSRGARVALEEAVIQKAVEGQWKSSLAHLSLGESIRPYFREDGSLSDEGIEFMVRFKQDGLGDAETQLVRGVIHALFGGKTAVIQGYGKVGRPLHAELNRLGVKVIAVGDETAIVHNSGGLDPNALAGYTLTEGGGRVFGFRGDDGKYDKAPVDEVLEIPCDILIPAAVEEVITARNAGKINAKIIVEAANDPTTATADEILDQRVIIRIPDIVANSGGVWASYFEWALNLSPGIQKYGEYVEPIMKIYRRLHEDQASKNLHELTNQELVEVHEQGMRDVYRSVQNVSHEFNVPLRQASCMRTILNLAERVAEAT